MTNYNFRPFDFKTDGALVSKFLEETVQIGKMNPKPSLKKYTDGYLDFIIQKQQFNPEWFVMYCKNNDVIGFAGTTQSEKYPSSGMISFLYLLPENRKSGHGRKLEKYSIEQLRKCGCTKALLTVSSENINAVQFYKKLDWEIVRQNGEHPVIFTMKKSID